VSEIDLSQDDRLDCLGLFLAEAEVPRLELRVERTRETYGHLQPGVLEAIGEVLAGVRAELASRFTGTLPSPRPEQQQIGSLLERLRRVSRRYSRCPAVTAWRTLWLDLARLDESLHELIQLEEVLVRSGSA
jgi:hypothetical protein